LPATGSNTLMEFRSAAHSRPPRGISIGAQLSKQLAERFKARSKNTWSNHYLGMQGVLVGDASLELEVVLCETQIILGRSELRRYREELTASSTNTTFSTTTRIRALLKCRPPTPKLGFSPRGSNSRTRCGGFCCEETRKYRERSGYERRHTLTFVVQSESFSVLLQPESTYNRE
jgi:hypothetical protein